MNLTYKDLPHEGIPATIPINASGGYGIGAILTSSSNGALVLDSYSALHNDRILVKNQSTQTQNGVYKVTTVAYDVAIGGLPFFYGISNERPYERQTYLSRGHSKIVDTESNADEVLQVMTLSYSH